MMSYIKSVHRNFIRNDGGFTLVELTVVAVIVGILVAVAMPVFLDASNNAKLRTCIASLRTIDGAIQTYGADNQTDPAGLNDLVPVYLKEIPDEPTGGSYIFVAADSTAPSHVECTSGHAY